MAAYSLELLLLDDRLAVCKLDPAVGLPTWAVRGAFSSITRTYDELSVVSPEEAVPADFRAEKGWRCFRVAGSMDFSAVGVLASMTAPLAGANIGIFATSTFDTDYLLVKEDDFERAIEALRATATPSPVRSGWSDHDPEIPLIFRPTRKLATKIKAGKLGSLPVAEDPLTDWSSHLFVANRVQYILLSNTTSLYSAVTYGRGITDVDGFIKGALFTLQETLQADGLGEAYERHILSGTAPIEFAGALGRAVTGSMNELVLQSKFLLEEGDLSPFDLAPRLNEVLLSSIAGYGKGGYATPRAALRAMLEGFGS